LEPIQPTDQII